MERNSRNEMKEEQERAFQEAQLRDQEREVMIKEQEQEMKLQEEIAEAKRRSEQEAKYGSGNISIFPFSNYQTFSQRSR